MATIKIPVGDFRGWLANKISPETTAIKLNPAQSSIASSELDAGPANILDWQSAYREIEIVHRCIDMIVGAAVGVPFLVEGGPAKKIDKLINRRPNPFEDRVSFFRRAILDYYLDGNTFFYYDRKQDEGSSLYLLPANDVTIIPDEKTFVKGYVYAPRSTSDTSISGFFTSNPPSRNESNEGQFFDAREIIHVKNTSDSSIYRGDSMLQPLDRLINLYNALLSFQQQFFSNNAVPGFVLSTDNVLSKKVKDRLLEEWRLSYTTIFKGARSPAILDGGLKVDSFSSVKFSELDFEASVERIQEDMAKTLGVPYVLLKSGNNANIINNEKLFYSHTVLPVLDAFASAFERRFGIDTTITPDRKSVTALRADIVAQSDYWASLVNTGIATPAEARDDLRLPEMSGPEVDDIRMPENITGSATNPSIGGRPAKPKPSDKE